MTGPAAGAYRLMYIGVLIVLGILLLLCLIRSVCGPRIADRIISVNMIGTLTVIVIAVLAFLMDENYLTDVATIYTLLSFLAVVVLTKIYIGVWHARKHEERDEER